MKLTTPSPIGVPEDNVSGRPQTTGHFGLSRGRPVELGCLLCWFGITAVTAQESAAPVFVACLASTLQPDPSLSCSQDGLDQPARRPATRADLPITVLHRAQTDAAAWATFEAEYRPDQPSLSPIKHQIATAKYGLDVAVFAVDRFVKNVRDHADFEFDQGHLRRTRANARGGFLDNPRVKLDLDTTLGKPYVGARLVIPFGK